MRSSPKLKKSVQKKIVLTILLRILSEDGSIQEPKHVRICRIIYLFEI